MKKLLSIIFFASLLLSANAYANVFKLNSCYKNKFIQKDNIWGPQDKEWNKKSWEEFRKSPRSGKPILDYYIAKEYLPNNIDLDQYRKLAKSAGYSDGLGVKEVATEQEKIDAINFFTKYSLFYEEYFSIEGNYFSINFDSGKIRHKEIYTEDHINTKIKINQIRNKWKKNEYPDYEVMRYVPEDSLERVYIINDYTEDTVISKNKKTYLPNDNSAYVDGARVETDFEINLITGIIKKKHKVVQPKYYSYIRTEYLCLTEDNSNEGGNLSGSSGTAFFINKKGYLLTNNHVVDGCTLSKISYKNKEYDTKLIATDKTLDLALLKAELKPKTFINFSKDEAKKLDTIYVAGYPLGKGLSDDLKINPGAVSSLKGFEDNSNEIQIDAPINPGNSGGPIINENGNLIAIAVSGMAKDQTEGINFGIKSSAAELFLKSNNINVDKSLYSRSKNKEQLRNILEEGTVYTYCN